MLCVKSEKTGVKSEKTGKMKWKTRITISESGIQCWKTCKTDRKRAYIMRKTIIKSGKTVMKYEKTVMKMW